MVVEEGPSGSEIGGIKSWFGGRWDLDGGRQCGARESGNLCLFFSYNRLLR